jgi:ABC-type transport system involved in cytochrome c biogenesis permease subunit
MFLSHRKYHFNFNWGEFMKPITRGLSLLFLFFLFSILISSNLYAQLPAGHPPISETNNPPPAASTSSPQTANNPPSSLSPEQITEAFVANAKLIDTTEIERAAIQQNGRIKPFDTFARESILFIMGRYTKWGLSSAQIYLGLIAYNQSPNFEIIEVRNLELRKKLGFLKSKKYYAVNELESSPLTQLAAPIFKLQEQNSKSLTELDKQILETYHQLSILRDIISAEHFFMALDFSLFKNEDRQQRSPSADLQQAYGKFLQSLKSGDASETLQNAKYVVQFSRSQDCPELLRHYLNSLDTEIIFNKLSPFFWAAILTLLSGLAFLANHRKKILNRSASLILFMITLIPLMIGLGFRVYITEFAPVTNMYGTMIWVSLGIALFSCILYFFYESSLLSGFMLLGSGLILWITQSIPLVLNPDMDPIVAVLRNNFWLSTHVTTITISYSALTMAMILGNIALIRTWIVKDNQKFFKEYAHYTYRLIQLGCFLLTVGIILGGIWADYSWGRFWGWDPKETWALIADLGFLAILHARYVGWVDDFAILAWSPVAYLFVVMAWYGVNFILAAGLHSYGFSSGGAVTIAVFVLTQITLITITLIKIKLTQLKHHTS